jgi:hypothetical protein
VVEDEEKKGGMEEWKRVSEGGGMVEWERKEEERNERMQKRRASFCLAGGSGEDENKKADN